MSRRRILLFTLAAVVGLLGVAVVGVLLWADSGAGRAFAVRTLTEALEAPDQRLVIESHEGSLLSDLSLTGITLADGDGAWLTAGSARLRWRPGTLLTGTLTVDDLVVEDLAVLREPASGAEDDTPSGPFEVPSLPVEIVIGNLQVDQVSLDESLLGVPASFRITGNAGTEQRAVLRSALLVERSDGVPGKLEAEATYAPGSDRLTLDLQVAEPAGGLAARLLDLPDLPPVALSLSGDGTLAKWPGTLQAELEDLLRIEASIGLARVENGLRAAIESRATPEGAFAAPDAGLLWGLLAGGLDLSLDLVAGDDDSLELSRLTLNSTAVTADLTAKLDLVDENVMAEGRVALRDPAALGDTLGPVSLAGAELTLQAGGALRQPEIVLALQARDLTGPDLAVDQVLADLSLTPDTDATSGTLRGTGKILGLSLEPAATTDALLGPEIGWSLDGTIDLQTLEAEVARLAIDAAAIGLETAGQADLNTGDLRFDLAGEIKNLNSLEALAGMPLQGRTSFSAQLDARQFGAALSARIEGRTEDLDIGEPAATALLGPTPSYAADLNLASDGGLAVQAMRIEGSALWLTGDLTLTPDGETLDGTFDLALESLAPLAEALAMPLSGGLNVGAKLSGPVADPAVAASVDGTDLVVTEVAVGPMTLTVEADTLATAPKGTLQAELPVLAGGVTGALGFELKDSRLALTALQVAAPETEAKGDLVLQLDGGLAEGAVSLTSGDLGPWLAFAGLAGTGKLAADARLSATAGQQGASVDASLDGLTLTDGASPLRIGGAELALTARDVTSLQAEDLSVSLRDVDAGEATLAEASLRGSGGQAGLDFNLSARGDALGPFDLVGEGRVVVGDAGIALTLDRLSGTALDQPFAQTNPLDLESGQNGHRLSGLDLSFGPARLRGSAQLSDQAVAADVTVEGLALDLLAAVAPDLPVDGVLSGEAQLAGSPSAPRGNATLQLGEIALAEARDLPPLSADLTADWQNARLALDLVLAGFAGEPARIEAALPLALDPATLTPEIDDGAPISGQVAWQGDLQEVMPLVPAADQVAAGPASLALTVGGTLADPRLSGDLTLDGARFENLETGTLLNELNLALALEGERATLARLEANDGGDGRLSGSGSLAVAPERDFPFELSLTFEDFTGLRRDDITASQSGDLTIKGTLQEVLLSGALTIEPVEITISNDLPPEVVDLQVVEVNNAAVGKEDPKDAEQAEAGPVIDLDLKVDLPKRTYVRGLGLESEWGGAFAITGDSSAPEIDGKLSVIRGQLSLLGRVFQLTRGSVGLVPGGEIDPVLDIEAQNQRGDLTATVLITGRASKPELTLTSVPELPQDEILARVLFDKSTSELSTFEAVQLAEAVASFTTGASGSSGVLNLARETLGLDVLRVESGEGANAGPSVSAGQYVADGVYVGVKQGAQPGSSSVGVEVELTPNISVTSDVGQSGESDLGVKFQWDY